MKYRIALLILLPIFFFAAAGAQTVTGEWLGVGHVKKNGDYSTYLCNIVLTQKGNKVTGVFKYFFKSDSIKIKISGIYYPTHRRLELSATPIINYQALNANGPDCTMEGGFTLMVTKLESTLTGQFNPPKESHYVCPAIDMKLVKYDPALEEDLPVEEQAIVEVDNNVSDLRPDSIVPPPVKVAQIEKAIGEPTLKDTICTVVNKDTTTTPRAVKDSVQPELKVKDSLPEVPITIVTQPVPNTIITKDEIKPATTIEEKPKDIAAVPDTAKSQIVAKSQLPSKEVLKDTTSLAAVAKETVTAANPIKIIANPVIPAKEPKESINSVKETNTPAIAAEKKAQAVVVKTDTSKTLVAAKVPTKRGGLLANITASFRSVLNRPKTPEKNNVTPVAVARNDKKAKSNVTEATPLPGPQKDPVKPAMASLDSSKRGVPTEPVYKPVVITRTLNPNEKFIRQLYNRSFEPAAPVYEIDVDSIRVTLYDNGEIDNDTISVFFNRKPVVLKRMLSTQPLSMRFKVDTTVCEISMFADNLGLIPPNTAIAIIYAGEQRYEINLISSMISNATIRFKKRLKHLASKN